MSFHNVSRVLLTAVFLAAPVGIAQAGERGLIGPGQCGPDTKVAPPRSPDAWHKVERNVLDSRRAWGRRFKPRAVFQIPGGIGVLYNSVPPRGFRAPRGFASGQTSSLAFSRNLLDWHDYPGNPVMHQLADWQGTRRAMPRAMLYDQKNEQWVVYFVDHTGKYPGIRAAGTAYSTDLVNWRPSTAPTITVDDYLRAVPEPRHVKATVEQLRREGCIYPSWAMYHDGRYYVQIQILGRRRRPITDAQRAVELLVADEPGGPFEYVECRGDFIPRQRPVYSGGRWYTVFAGNLVDGEFIVPNGLDIPDSQPGFGLAWSDDLLGPYETNPHNPIITTNSAQRTRPQLFRYNGTWAILFGEGPAPGPMRLAVAHIHPSLLRVVDENDQ